MAVDHAYFDTSGVVKLVLKEEEGADLAASLWEEAGTVYTSWLTYPETRSALARTHRDGELADSELEDACVLFDALWPRFNLVDLNPAVARRAGELVSQYPLSGADAVHIASALAVRIGAVMTFASWDNRQIEAAEALGLLVQPPRS